LTARFAGIRLVAFDLDGTLVDSVPDLCHCLGCALASVGLPRPTEDETRSWIGDGVEALVERGLAHKGAAQAQSGAGDAAAAHDFDAAYAEFLRCYARNLFVRTKLYPGVVETLDALADRGLRLCCITNKRVKFALDVLEQAGIRERFELVLGGDSLPDKKPSPVQLHAAGNAFGIDAAEQAGACMLVGDSVNDQAASAAAGWAFAWAAYGYGQPAMPREYGGHSAVARIDSIADLTALLPDPDAPDYFVEDSGSAP
jgi:phosphoglycolate phosphatase